MDAFLSKRFNRRVEGPLRHWGAVWLASVLLVCGALQAQTLHFVLPQSGVVDMTQSAPNLPRRVVGVAVDASGNVYLGDDRSNFLQTGRVLKETPSTGGVYVPSTFGSCPLAPTTFEPTFLAADGAGNVYVSDTVDGEVFKFLPAGGCVLVGSSVPTLGQAALHAPKGLAVDAGGTVYIYDEYATLSSSYVVKAVPNAAGASYTSSQVLTTSDNTQGLAVDAAGNLYLALAGGLNEVVRAIYTGGVYVLDPTPVATQFFPVGLAVDASGRVYVTDANGRVLRETPNGNGYSESVVATFAAGVEGVALDAAGNLYVSDGATGSQVYRIQTTPLDLGTVTLGSAPATATLNVAFDNGGGLGSISVSTQGGATGSDYTQAGGICSTTCTINVKFAPTSPGTRPGRVALTDGGGHTVTQLLTGVGQGPLAALTPGIMGALAGNGTAGFTGDGGAAAMAELSNPNGLALDSDGNLYIADQANSRVRRVGAANGTITTVAGNGGAGYSGDGGPATAAQTTPFRLALDTAGNLFLDDLGYGVRRVDAVTGMITAVAGTGVAGFSGDGGPATVARLGGPGGLAFDAAGNLYIADSGNARVRLVTSGTGVITTVAGNGSAVTGGDGGPATAAGLGNPNGLAIDSVGSLYIAVPGNNVIRKVDRNGTITTVAGTGTAGFGGDGGPATAALLSGPQDLATDVAGNVYIADTGNNRIRRLNVGTGVITTVAGSGATPDVGDGGAATAAGLFGPDGIAIGPAGSLYLSDRLHQRVRQVAVSGSALNFAPTNVGTVSSDSPQSVTLLNAGNAALGVPAPASGTNPSAPASFSLVSGTATTCPVVAAGAAAGSLSAGGECTYGVQFVPQAPGSLSGTLTIADLSLNATSTQTVTLTGTGNRFSATVTVPPQSVVYTASSVTVTATIAYAGAVAPTGAVTISLGPNNGTGTCTVSGTSRVCTATFGIAYQHAGSDTITVTEAADSTFNAAIGSGTLTLIQPVATVTASPATVVYGSASVTLAAQVSYTGPVPPTGGLTFQVGTGAAVSAVCSGAASPLSCAASYNTAALTASSVGYPITATEAPDPNFAASSGSSVLVVTRAPTVITWPTPAAIPVGTALSGQQLNATANIPATPVYTPPAGTVLSTGTHTLSVTFTPADTTDYAPATQQVSLAVLPLTAAPTFSTPTGGYTSPQMVTISDGTPGAAIFYTLNGATPTTASTRYSGPVSIPTTATLKAITSAPGYAPSTVTTAVYTIYQTPMCTLNVVGLPTPLAVSATVNCVIDPQSQLQTLTLNWGDGSPLQPVGNGAAATHTYGTGTTYTVSAVATVGVNALSTSTLSYTAQQTIAPHQLPVCTLATAVGVTGVSGNTVSTMLMATPSCTDPQGHGLQVSLNWGDPNGNASAPAPANNTGSFHTYTFTQPTPAVARNFDVTVTATDVLTGTATTSLTVLPVLTAPQPGGSTQPVTGPLASPTPITVSFVCAGVSGVTSAGLTLINAPCSTVGITSTVTLDPTTTIATVAITTAAGSTVATLRDGATGQRAVVYAVAFPASLLLGLAGGLGLSGHRRRRRWVPTLGIALVCLGLSSCGGSFVPPPTVATPVGSFYVTILPVQTGGGALPTAFIQTSLIVPLRVGP